MAPVRRSQIWPQLATHVSAALDSTYTNAPVGAARHKMNIVELQSSHRPSVANKTPVHLAASQIPQAHHAVGGTTGECGVEDLDGSYEISRRVRRTSSLFP